MTDTAVLADRWEMQGRGESIAPPVLSQRSKFKFYTPLADATDEFVRWAQSPHERIYTGLPELDAQMRGLAPGEMAVILGYSHGGKTLLLLEILKKNRDKRIAFFTPDETRVLVLIKLACVYHGLDALDLERSIASDDARSIELLRATAEEHFPNLAVFDQSMSLHDMDKAVNETSDVWGAAPELVVFDYLELLQGSGEDVPSKANTIKAWGRRHEVPLLVLHQTSRTAGADGKKMSISSGAFGGEQQSTHMIGVRRKRFDIQAQIVDLVEKIERGEGGRAQERQQDRLSLLRYEEQVHAHTVTVNLVKNKRPGGTLVDDMDFEIEAGSGRLTRLQKGDLPEQYLNDVRESF